MVNCLFSPWPQYSELEIEAVSNVLRSGKVNYWTGDKVREFEKAFAEWTESEYAIAVANGTLALELALVALGVGVDDDVIVTPRSYFASASCVVTAGANPVFADVDEQSQNITAASIETVITPKSRAIIVVHHAGVPAEMDEIMELARRHNLYVIEDCAQAHGAKYKNHSVGSIGHIGAWSFCQDKIMTTGGEGGMVTTNDKVFWSKMWSYKDHGKSYSAVYEKSHNPGFRWLQYDFGSNWRMTEMQAAIGLVQLTYIESWLSKRRANAEKINSAVCRCKLIRIPKIASHMVCAEYKHYLFVCPELFNDGWNRGKLVSEIVSRGVPCYHGGCSEIYLEKAFDSTPWRPKKRLSNAKKLGETSLMFLVHPTLQDHEIQKTCDVLQNVLSLAGG